MIKKTILLAIMFVLILPVASLANGGDQRVVNKKYLISLSRAPFTPIVGVKTSFLASFVDIQKGKLINEDLIVKVRVSKHGAVAGKFIFEKENIIAQRGVLDFPYTFEESGLHEIFFDFAFLSDPKKIYHAPDFLMDVQKAETSALSSDNTFPYLFVVISLFAGLIIGFGISHFYNCKRKKAFSS